MQALNLKPERKGFFYVIVHQVYGNDITDLALPNSISRDDVTYVRLDYPGLSKSRYVGISFVKTKYFYIMDDDVNFNLNQLDKLIDWMDSNQVDVSTSKFVLENGSYPKEYKAHPFKHTFISAAKVSSIEICAKTEVIKNSGVLFDVNFGLGSELPSGEEYIFITDCIKSDLKVWFSPVTIGVHPNETSGRDFYTAPNKALAKREMLTRIFGRKAFVFIFAFWLKKIPIVIKAGYFWQFSKAMLLGTK